MREKGLIGKRCEREKVCVIEGIMRWNWVGAEFLMWQALENAKNFLSASGFNLDYRFLGTCGLSNLGF